MTVDKASTWLVRRLRAFTDNEMPKFFLALFFPLFQYEVKRLSRMNGLPFTVLARRECVLDKHKRRPKYTFKGRISLFLSSAKVALFSVYRTITFLSEGNAKTAKKLKNLS